MNEVKEKNATPIQNDNLKNLKPFSGKKGATTPSLPTTKTPVENAKPILSKEANKEIHSNEESKNIENKTDNIDIAKKAENVAQTLSKVPILPIAVPKAEVNIEKKLADVAHEKIHFIKKPAVLFIEGFSAFGISNGDGIKDMADNYPGAKLFSWNEKDKILDEIKKHAPDQPVVLVGHSLGGEAAIDVANELNNAKHAFRNVDLLVSIDSVGFNDTIIPMNVKRNLNFFQEGMIPFLHGNPTVARNTDYTEVINELRTEMHSKIDDSPEVQYKIFEHINQTLHQPNNQEMVFEISGEDLMKGLSQFLTKEA